ncbi:transcriptional repressor [Anaerovibrio sp.]|uniref:Fur family transcriptional regulator n=1 Tax=Anaerovibrio sp. TaxID=1872532 RepID=UPI001B677AFC|nr:transcriptional repressor [Anaerovibrio sp.]MBP3232414.1 transcriptional repressor [Anaerovibrio sp.]MBR2143743.1 transcriptional repressor [Anaerovibrio sp.]
MQAGFSVDELKKRLQNSKYKLTHQRQDVLEVFLDRAGEHLSAEEVHRILRDKDYDIGLATVYRTLELMCSPEMGILQKMEFGEKKARYELKKFEPNAHQHHHLICKKCDKVIEFSEDMLEELEEKIAKECNFKIIDHQVIFYGYCQECQ